MHEYLINRTYRQHFNKLHIVTYCLLFRVTICYRVLVNKEIGERLKEIRNREGLSQAAMAKLCDVTRPAWTQWETGIRRIPPEAACKLFVKLRVSVTWIYVGAVD